MALSDCLLVVNGIQPTDEADLLARMDEYVQAGISAPEAGKLAANDMLAEIQADIADGNKMLTEQHADLFGTVQDYDPAEPEKPEAPKPYESQFFSRVEPVTISTRNPSGKKATENAITDNLNIDLAAMRRSGNFDKAMEIVGSYTNLPAQESTQSSDEIARALIDHAKRNLRFLYDKVPPNIRARSKLWYDGANRIAERFSGQFDVTRSQAAGVLAALSPQKDWFINVDLAKRVLSIMRDQRSTAWTPEMQAVAQKIVPSKHRSLVIGKTLGEVVEPLHKAMWVRVYDETYNDREHQVITPEGDEAGVRKAGGKARKTAWGDFGSIAKAVSIIEDGSRENISNRLGKEHKVRSFYNNIIDPNSDGGHVTIDTHAVAAALLQSLSGKAREVLHNFGGNIKGEPGPGGSALTGTSGTYGLFADAYRELAAELGLLPRELQSITWEAVRGLFPDKRKKGLSAPVRALWAQHRSGKITQESAQQMVLALAGKINDPEWFRPGTGSPDLNGRRADTGQLSGGVLPAGRDSNGDGRGADRGLAGNLSVRGDASIRADRGRLNDTRFSRRQSPLGFYSELAAKVEQGSNKAPAVAWKSYIKALTQKGVKPDEIEWSGVNDWLDLQQGTVTKEAVMAYLNEGGVKVEETVLGAPLNAADLSGRPLLARMYEEAIDRAVEADVSTNPAYIAGLPVDQRAPEEAELLEAYTLLNESPDESWLYERGEPTKYGSYQLPGGENYREVLLTLPDKDGPEPSKMARMYAGSQSMALTGLSDEAVPAVAAGLAARAGVDVPDMIAAINAVRGKRKEGYVSSHWDQPNILAHIRLNDRTDADGKRVLFVEELQSDWGQEGKKKGFNPAKKTPPKLVVQEQSYGWEVYNESHGRIAQDEDGNDAVFDNRRDAEAMRDQIMRDPYEAASGVPAAPFVTKTEGWLNLALKRVMVMAAEGGYDKVAFVNGKQSAERYSLNQAVNYIQWNPGDQDSKLISLEKKGGGTSYLASKNGVIYESEVGGEGKPLEDLLGKAVAERIEAENSGSLRGLQLDIGGEGMKTFYDSIVPMTLKKLLPKVGGGQMGMVSMERGAPSRSPSEGTPFLDWMGQTHPEVMRVDAARAWSSGVDNNAFVKEFYDLNKAMQQPGFDITPAMREKVETTGLPMFSRRQSPNTPEFKRWFGDSKVVDAEGRPMVVYHGTNADITEFDGSDFPGWFAASPELAARYLRDPSSFSAPNIMPVYLSIKNPLRLKVEMNDSREAALREIGRLGFDVGGSYASGPSAYAIISDAKFQEQLFDGGYDGVIVKEDGVDTYAPVLQRQIKSATGNNGNFDGVNPDIRFARRQQGRFNLREFGKGAVVIENIQDRYNRWKQAIDDVRAQGGSVDEDNDFYLTEERYWGKVGAKIEDFGKEVEKFIDDVVKDGFTVADITYYAYAQHAQERNAVIASKRVTMPDGGSGMSNDDAQMILDDAVASGLEPMLSRHADALRQFTKGTRDLLLAEGLISQDEFDGWEQSFQFYVPLKGLPDGMPEGPIKQGTGQGFGAIRGKESKEAMGRKSEAKQILEAIIQDRTRSIIRAGKNEVLRSFALFVMDNPDPTLWEINAVENKPFSKIDANGDRIIEEELRVVNDDRTVVLKDGGKEVYILVNDPTLLKQMKNLHVENVGKFIGGMLMINRFMGRMYTSLNPVFTVLNFARDVTAAGFGMVDEIGLMGAAKLYANLPSSVIDAYRYEFKGSDKQGRFLRDLVTARKPSAEYELYRATGGKTGFFDFKTIDAISDDITAMVKNSERKAIDPRKFGPKVLPLVEAMNAGLENATRLAAFKTARQSGKSLAEASRISKNITVNFNRKGAMTPSLSAWFLFFNPAVQGTTRMLQALASPKVMATVGAAMGGIAALAIRNVGMGEDDDGVAWWDKIPSEVKERNIIFILPPGASSGEAIEGSKIGRYVKIPMPYGYNFFAVAANQFVDVYRHNEDPRRGRSAWAGTKQAMSAFIRAWLPVPEIGASFENPKAFAAGVAPAAVKPFVQNAINLNAFGREMYPEGPGEMGMPDSGKYFTGQQGTIFQTTADRLNKLAGGNEFQRADIGLLDLAPAQIENLARAYGGGPLSFTLDIFNAFYVRQHIERPEVDMKRLPFIKQTFGVIDDETDRVLAYERMGKATEAVNPFEQAKRAKTEAGDLAARGIAEEYKDMVALGGVLKSVRKDLTKLRKEELAIVTGEGTDAAKFTRLQALNSERRKVLQSFNRAYDVSVIQTKQAASLLQREAVAEP